jgi:hypothetical protein
VQEADGLAAWLPMGARGQSASCLAVLAENMVETVEDLLFVAHSRSKLLSFGMAEANVIALWASICEVTGQD